MVAIRIHVSMSSRSAYLLCYLLVVLLFIHICAYICIKHIGGIRDLGHGGAGCSGKIQALHNIYYTCTYAY